MSPNIQHIKMIKVINNNAFLLFLISSLSLISCLEKPVTIPVPQKDNEMTLNAFLSPNDGVQAQISLSQSVFKEGRTFPLVNDAEVSIFEANNLLKSIANSQTERENDFNFVDENVSIQSGNTYTIKVENSKYKSVEATVQIPKKPLFNLTESIAFSESKSVSSTSDDFGFRYNTELIFDLKKEDNEEAFYQIRVFQKQKDFETGEITLSNVVSIDYSSNTNNFDREVENGSSFFMRMEPDKNSESIKLRAFLQSERDESGSDIVYYKIEVNRINSSLYFYFLSRQTQFETDGNPFASPVVVNSNTSNELGIVGALNKTDYSGSVQIN